MDFTFMETLERIPGGGQEEAFCLQKEYYLNKPQDFWNNVLQTAETKAEMFG